MSLMVRAKSTSYKDEIEDKDTDKAGPVSQVGKMKPREEGSLPIILTDMQ